jgi:hypothetical protein
MLGVIMAKGRKRKLGDRYPNGELHNPGRDRGTAEAQHRRALLAGFTKNDNGKLEPGDPVMTTCPLDILIVRNLISPEQYKAGCEYARLYSAIIGTPKAAMVNYTGEQLGKEPITEPDEKRLEWEARTQRSFQAAQSVLKGISRKVKTLVDNVAIYGRLPPWAVKSMPSDAECRERGQLLEALHHLAVEFGYVQRRRAA